MQFGSTGRNAWQADFHPSQPRAIQPGQVMTTSARFFAGAKEVNLLNAYQDQGVTLFGKAID